MAKKLSLNASQRAGVFGRIAARNMKKIADLRKINSPELERINDIRRKKGLEALTMEEAFKNLGLSEARLSRAMLDGLNASQKRMVLKKAFLQALTAIEKRGKNKKKV